MLQAIGGPNEKDAFTTKSPNIRIFALFEIKTFTTNDKFPLKFPLRILANQRLQQ